jgi:hypothetical protein
VAFAGQLYLKSLTLMQALVNILCNTLLRLVKATLTYVTLASGMRTHILGNCLIN